MDQEYNTNFNKYKLIDFYTRDDQKSEEAKDFLTKNCISFKRVDDSRYVWLIDQSMDDSWISKNINTIRWLFRSIQWSNKFDIIEELITMETSNNS